MKARQRVEGRGRSLALSLAGLALSILTGMFACSARESRDAPDASTPVGLALLAAAPPLSRRPVPTVPNYMAGPADSSRSVVQRAPRVSVSHPYLSLPLRDVPDAIAVEEREGHAPGRNPFSVSLAHRADPVLQTMLPIANMPATVHNFLGQGTTQGGCIFPKPDAGEPPGCTTRGDPPDTVGAVGPNHYVQVVNTGIGIWDKNGAPLITPKFTSSLWTGYPGTDGNRCAAGPKPDPPGGDWGDAVVLYDQMADRWFVTQFEITNGVNANTGPSYQCVAVSQTGDPTGAYFLYDFQYATAINDYGKFSVWPDAYYASFNDFDGGFSGANLCAYDRVSMLAGQPATQQCFGSNDFGFLPASVDGAIKPPRGEPGFFLELGTDAVLLYTFHVDWTTPANSAFTGPTNLPVAPFSGLCSGGNCVPQAAPGNPLAALGDRPMFHLSYRNYGAVESLVFNHSVDTGTQGAPRWYEIRSPNGTPTVFQQGTYAPSDGNFRWMGSMAQDQAQDMALGYSISSGTTVPSIAWTGRTASDPAGTMAASEGIVETGAGVETGNFKNGQPAERWGDYSNMTVDPSDDCTFWYTTELYPSNGVYDWDTRIASVKFPNCAANDFTIAAAPASLNLHEGSQVAFTITTALAKGSAEAIALYVQDLPSGVTAAFVPPTVTAGSPSTLTLKATLTAPLASNVTFTVIGKAPSAVHPAMAQVSVLTTCAPLTACPAPDDCGTIADGCGGTVTCGPACAAPKSCGGGGAANVCGCTPLASCPSPDNCGTVPDNCGGMVSCGTCSGGAACKNHRCEAPTVDAGADSGARRDAGDSGSSGDANGDGGNDAITGDSTGCGCRTVDGKTPSRAWALFGIGGFALLARRRRRATRR